MTTESSTEPELDAEPEPDSEAGDEDAAPSTPSTRLRRTSRLALVLVLVAAVFVAASSVLWWRAAHDSSLELAQTRDAALIDARREVEVLTTLDHRQVDAGLARWLEVSTGPLHDQLSTVDDAARKALADAGKVSTGKVVDAAMTSLDERAGTAAGIATVEISVTDATGENTTKRDRFSIELARVKGTWLVSRLDQVPVGLS